jgi:hypothetical protein
MTNDNPVVLDNVWFQQKGTKGATVVVVIVVVLFKLVVGETADIGSHNVNFANTKQFN